MIGGSPEVDSAAPLKSFASRRRSTLTSFARLEAGPVEAQFQCVLKRDWTHFDWLHDCEKIYEGSMKVVGCLKSHPGVAIASVLRGSGEKLIREEVATLTKLAAENIRTIEFSDQILEVPSFDSSAGITANAYLIQHFSDETAFFFEEGEPGTDDYFKEPMRKLKILSNDEGDWTINRDTIRVLKEHGLEEEFMDDISSYVAYMQSTGERINDFQGLLGKDGHFYVADPLKIQPIDTKVNRHLLEGIFMESEKPCRNNKAYKAAFVHGLGVELEVHVPDEE